MFRTNRLRDHVGRSATQTVAQSLILIALSLMPIAGAMAINFSAPLFATLFAALWLKEKIGRARGAALLVGFAGVLLVASPGADSFRIGALFAIGNAVLYGSVTAAVRGMSATESAETLTMYQMLFMGAFFLLMLPAVGFICRPARMPPPCSPPAFSTASANIGGRARCRSPRRRRSGRSIISRWCGR